MARPVNANAAETRAKILRAARQLLGESGREGVKVREIARMAGLSPGIVNHYFGGKDQLVEACVEATYEELGQFRTQVEGLMLQGGPTMELAENSLRMGFRFAREHRVTARVMLRQAVESGALEQKRSDQVLVPILQLLEGVLAPKMGLPGSEIRLRVQSLIFLAVRYAVCSDAELVKIAGGGASKTTAPKLVEDHLIQTLHALFPAGAFDA